MDEEREEKDLGKEARNFTEKSFVIYANREAISGSDHMARHLYETVTHFKYFLDINY